MLKAKIREEFPEAQKAAVCPRYPAPFQGTYRFLIVVISASK